MVESSELDTSLAYKVEGHGGVAWRIEGYAVESREVQILDYEDHETGEEYWYTEYEEYEDKTRVRMHMVGDDHTWTFDVSDITPIEEDEFCHSCGQIGCGHNVYS